MEVSGKRRCRILRVLRGECVCGGGGLSSIYLGVGIYLSVSSTAPITS